VDTAYADPIPAAYLFTNDNEPPLNELQTQNKPPPSPSARHGINEQHTNKIVALATYIAPPFAELVQSVNISPLSSMSVSRL
jgi:hypothetical protein